MTEATRESTGSSDIVSVVAHELRQPLTSIVGLTDVLLARGEELEPEERRELLERLGTRTAEMLEMVEHLLEAGRLEAGACPLSVRETDIVGPVRQAAEAVPVDASHTVLFRQEGNVPPVVCDPDRVKNVVGNLVSNALRYSPDGGTVSVSVETGSEQVLISVSDEGVGIAEEDLEMVFEPFTQPDAGTTAHRGGFGLGLYIVRCIAEAHGGTVEVVSEPGVGSTFTVTLPVSGPPHQGREG